MHNSGKLTCTVCPRGCQLEWFRQGGDIQIAGAGCPRGTTFGREELTNPVRTLTTTVWVEKGLHPLVPVRSSHPVPKDRLPQAMRDLASVRVQAPLPAGSVVLANWRGLGINFITTRSIPKFEQKEG